MNKNTFAGSLFDFTFDQFITTKMIKILYILAMLGSAIAGLSVLIAGVTEGTIVGILGGLIGGIITAIVSLIISRLGLELAIVIFRIADNISVIAKQEKIQ